MLTHQASAHAIVGTPVRHALARSSAIRLWRLWVLLAGYVLLALTWNWLVPVYEAPDEPDHAQYVNYVLTHGGLPDSHALLGVAGVESLQPPLYYLVAATLLRASGTPAFYVRPVETPGFDYGAVPPNRFLPHTSGDERILHWLRALSIAGGVLAVAATFALALELGQSQSVALTAAAIVALLPQFTFITAAISNDSIAAASGALCLWLVVRKYGAPRWTWRDSLWLGLAAGLGALSKASLLALVPVAYLPVLRHERRSAAALLRGTLTYATGFLAGGGWFYLRNLYLYGDPLDSQGWLLVAPEQVLPDSFRFSYVTHSFPVLAFRSLVGMFGWANLPLPEPLYLLCGILVCLAAGSLWYWAWTHRRLPEQRWLIVALAVAAVVGAWLLRNLTYNSFQGRLIFPALAGVAVLLARGLAAYPVPVRSLLLRGTVLGLLALNLFSLWVVYSTYR